MDIERSPNNSFKGVITFENQDELVQFATRAPLLSRIYMRATMDPMIPMPEFPYTTTVSDTVIARVGATIMEYGQGKSYREQPDRQEREREILSKILDYFGVHQASS